MEHLCAAIFLIVLLILRTVTANYVVEISLLNWVNPLKVEHNMECCDRDNFFPNCSDSVRCHTRFDICLQPFAFSDANCPYGRYSSRHDPSFPDPDNITFTAGVTIAGNVPNPMTFSVLETASGTSRLRLIVSVHEDDFGYGNDEFIDTVTFLIPLSTGSDVLQLTGEEGIGTLGIGYHVRCLDGFCGSNCSRQNCGVTTTSAAVSATPLPTQQQISTSDELATKFEYYILLSVLSFVCLLVMICGCIIIGTLCSFRKMKTSDKVDKTVQRQPMMTTTTSSSSSPPSVAAAQSLPTLQPAVYPESRFVNSNSYRSSFPHSLSLSTQFTSVHQLSQEEEQEPDYDYTCTNNINSVYLTPTSSLTNPTGLYMNPAYGSSNDVQ